MSVTGVANASTQHNCKVDIEQNGVTETVSLTVTTRVVDPHNPSNMKPDPKDLIKLQKFPYYLWVQIDKQVGKKDAYYVYVANLHSAPQVSNGSLIVSAGAASLNKAVKHITFGGQSRLADGPLNIMSTCDIP
jgi:hypothetical protein